MRKVALIGSSGGGTATLGHTEPDSFLKRIQRELRSIDGSAILVEALFCSTDDGSGFDAIEDDTGAYSVTLHQVSGGDFQPRYSEALLKVNGRVAELETRIASGIERGEIDGLICISCKVDLFENTLTQAGKKGIPVTGTGGSSLSHMAAKYNVRLVGNSGGSVATTSSTRAISYCHALAQDWKTNYDPFQSSQNGPLPSWRSVLNSCLPLFWGVAIGKKLLQSYVASFIVKDADFLLNVLSSNVLPTSCAIVMATSQKQSSNVIMASILGSAFCSQSVVAGLMSGWLAAYIEDRMTINCILYWNIPATMTNLLSTSVAGAFSAVLVSPFIGPMRLMTSFFRRQVIGYLVDESSGFDELLRMALLAVFGCLMCYCSKVGYYHLACLPMILVEMELGEASLLGAMDHLTLVMVSAGVCAGNIVTKTADFGLMKRGFAINLLCGDFVEVCYPFCEESRLIDFSCYAASAWSVGIITSRCKSSAYLPFPIAIWLANDWKRMTLSSTIAMGVPFVATVINNSLNKGATKKEN